MSDTFAEIAETFEFLDDWEEKYRYVIELGRDYAALDEVLRTDAIKVDGCASQVWMLPKLENDVFSFQGASDAIIVSGLVAILAALYNGKTSAQAREINATRRIRSIGSWAKLVRATFKRTSLYDPKNYGLPRAFIIIMQNWTLMGNCRGPHQGVSTC